ARLASWMAAKPTPPAPAWMSTVSPDRRWPNSKRQSSAVPKATGTQAAATMSAPSGTGQVTRAGTATFSAWEPDIMVATTRWPGRGRRALPMPGVRGRGLGHDAAQGTDVGVGQLEQLGGRLVHGGLQAVAGLEPCLGDHHRLHPPVGGRGPAFHEAPLLQLVHD